ncbi:MAG TPA: DUF2934 domain-containing protein [Terriglobia bacterium]|nr:DUF2934 domain-containing protein [Terriglobia bacterium]
MESTPAKAAAPRRKRAAAPSTPSMEGAPNGSAALHHGASGPAPYEEVAYRAYMLWEHRGRPDGSPDEDWYRAQEEIQTLRVNPGSGH